MSSHPPAPWELHGWGAQTLLLVRGQLATVYFASYESGTLRYRELIVARGLRWVGAAPRFIISRIWVDSAESVAGGRKIWHLPKDLAAFDVRQLQSGMRVSVRDANAILCEMDLTAARASVPVRAPVPSFGMEDGAIYPFTAHVNASIGFARVRARFADGGPFASFNRARTLAGWQFNRLSLRVDAP